MKRISNTLATMEYRRLMTLTSLNSVDIHPERQQPVLTKKVSLPYPIA